MSGMKDFLAAKMEADGMAALPDDEGERDAYLSKAQEALHVALRDAGIRVERHRD